MESFDYQSSASIGLTPIFTAVTWLGCLAVGVIGILVPSARRETAAKTVTPVQAIVIHVDLTQKAAPAASAINWQRKVRN